MTLAWEPVTLASGARAHYLQAGSGAPLVFLHSFVYPRTDDALFSALAAHFEAFLVLAPGCFDFEEIEELDDVHDLALYYDDVLRAVGLRRVHLVGHSFGGLVAAELAAHFPERAASLSLVCPYGFFDPEYPTVDLSTLPLDKLLAASGSPVGTELSGPGGPDEIEETLARSRAATAALKFMWPFPDQGLTRRAHRVPPGTLVIWGRNDGLNPPQYARRFAEALDDAELVEVDGGHFVPYERPDELAAQIAAHAHKQRSTMDDSMNSDEA